MAFLHFLERYILTHYRCENHLKKQWFVPFLFMVNILGFYQNVEMRHARSECGERGEAIARDSFPLPLWTASVSGVN